MYPRQPSSARNTASLPSASPLCASSGCWQFAHGGPRSPSATGPPGAADRDDRPRRLDIDLGRKTVRISDNLGRGWVFKNEYPFVSADRRRILLESGGGKESYVDRVSGLYAFHNQADGVTMRGPCQRAAPERPRF